MTTSDSIFGPELEGLLQEAARDPKSCLLRVPRPAVVLTPFDPIRRVSIATAGLSALDRHLLEVHRHELAFRLRELCVTLLEVQKRYSHSTSPVCRRTESELDSDLKRVLSDLRLALSLTGSDTPKGVAPLVRKSLAETDSEKLRVGLLARMSERLVSTCQARQYQAIDCYSRKQYRRTLSILMDLEGSPMSQIYRACNLQGVVAVHIRQGRFHEARSWSDASVALQQGSPNVHFNQLLVGIGCRDIARARQAALSLDALFSGFEEAIDPSIENARAQIAGGYLKLPPGSEALLRELQDGVSMPVSALLGAAACQV